jgi:hypothetical protein
VALQDRDVMHVLCCCCFCCVAQALARLAQPFLEWAATRLLSIAISCLCSAAAAAAAAAVLCAVAQALARLAQPFLEWAATRYQARLATNLKKYGLRYDDLYDPMMDLVRTSQWNRLMHRMFIV